MDTSHVALVGLLLRAGNARVSLLPRRDDDLTRQNLTRASHAAQMDFDISDVTDRW
jgi:hypothetical protein